MMQSTASKTTYCTQPTGTVSSASGSHIRRSAFPHNSLLPYVQCKIHSLRRPTKSLADLSDGVANSNIADFQTYGSDINEVYVTATLYGFGIPLYSVGSSSRTGRASQQEDNVSNAMKKGNIRQHSISNLSPMRYPSDIVWNGESLNFPTRCRDLARDACITFDIVGPSGEQGLLRNGKLKLQLYPRTKALPYCGPRVCQTPGLAFSMPSKINACLLLSRIEAVAKDQMQQQETRKQVYFTLDDLRNEWWRPYHQQHIDVDGSQHNEQREANINSSWEQGYSLKHEAVDQNWKASLILEQIESRYKKGNGTSNATSSSRNDVQQVNNDNRGNNGKNDSSSTNIYWLDKFTIERCRQILSQCDETEDELNASLMNPETPQYTLATNSFLIVELPIFSFPIVHEEQFYPHALHGASGSVTALDLALHKRHVMALQAAERTNAEGTAGTSPSNATLTESPQIALLKSKVAEEEDAGVSLVQFLDPEREDINPVEDKYRTLAHDLLRGVVDPTVKPNKEQRDRLQHIISSPTQYHYYLTREEKDLIWRFRFSLVDNRKALTKFLLAVDWTEDDEVVQAAELLEQWRKRSPIEVTDALKLLGKHVAFQTSLVRSYAIDTLTNAPDDELQLYLLQLVQALKYEELTIDDTHRRNGSTNALNSSSSSLAMFLIDRASKSISLANYLYWYLKVEMLEDANNRDRYGIVFAALQDRLSRVCTDTGVAHSLSPPHHHSQHKSLSVIIGSVTNKLGSSKLKSSCSSDDYDENFADFSYATNNTNISMWDRLLLQDMFITGIMECQMESREVRGKKDVKEKKLQELLSERGLHSIPNNVSVPIPSAPHFMVCGVNPSASRMFKSALYPAVIEFKLRETTMSAVPNESDSRSKYNNYLSSPTAHEALLKGSARTSSKGVAGAAANEQHVYHVIFKTGDDLRQDQLVVMMVRLMDGLLKRGALDLCLRSYSILATSPTSGLVEFVSGSIPISQVLANNNGSILQFFQKVSSSARQKYNIDHNILETYIRSCAGYCVISFLLGIGDRHLDNIMLLPSGHFFHIDFGFIFGRDPKPLPPPFRLTREMVDGMGGIDSPEYNRFCSLACQAYNTLRKHAGLILNLLHLMSDAGIADLSNSPIADADGVIAKVAERFRLELSDEQAESFFLGLINDSLAALAPRVMEVLHQLAVARR